MEKGVFLCAQVGGDFLGENQAYSVYMYEGGTFKFDGMTDFLEYGLLEYQFMRCVRGSFTHVRLNVGDVTAYRERVYTTADGTAVTLVLGPAKGLAIADDRFFCDRQFARRNGKRRLTHGDMEQFADGFNFSKLSPVQKPTEVEQEISAD